MTTDRRRCQTDRTPYVPIPSTTRLAAVSALRTRNYRSLRVVDSVTMLAPPTEYVTNQNGASRTVQIVVRPGIEQGVVDQLTESLAAVGWLDLHHAYGEASDLPALLFAIVVGTDVVRSPAWWELWGNIHHQGTVYQATVPSVRYIEGVAVSPEHPDRVEALSFCGRSPSVMGRSQAM